MGLTLAVGGRHSTQTRLAHQARFGLLPFSSEPAGCPGGNLAVGTTSTVGHLIAACPTFRLTLTPQLIPLASPTAPVNHLGLGFATT